MTDSTGCKGKILIVDDDPDIRALAELLLSKEGYHIITATNGADGVKIAKEAKPDLVLMDITMPDMDGYEATKLLKETAGLSQVPVIFLSGKTANEDGGKSFEAGGVSYIKKPFSGVQLRDLVNLVMMSLVSD